jgi:hypothetical protein
MIQAPHRRRAQAKASGSSEAVAVTLIGATEQSPPAGSDSISWVLLTNLPVEDFESATENEGSLFAATDVDNALIGLSAQGLSDDRVGFVIGRCKQRREQRREILVELKFHAAVCMTRSRASSAP